MPPTTATAADAAPHPNTGDRHARIYPIQSFLKIQALMLKLNLTPADCLGLLAEMLENLDRQIQEHEAEEDFPYPLAFYSETP